MFSFFLEDVDRLFVQVVKMCCDGMECFRVLMRIPRVGCFLSYSFQNNSKRKQIVNESGHVR